MTRGAPILAVLTAAAVVVTACGDGQPEGTEPGRLPSGQHVHALRAADDGTLLLGLHGALWRSTDGGATWEPAGLEGQDAMAIGIDPDTDGPILVGGHGVLARADDPTAGFTPLTPPELGSLDVHALAQAPSEPATAYAFVVDSGLFRTTDAGDSWEQVSPVGRDFGADITGLAVHPTDPDTLLLGGGRSGLLRSSDGGRSFDHVVGVGVLTVAYRDANGAAAVTARGIETSENGGETWQVATEPATLPGQPAALAADGQGTIWLVTEEPRTLQRSTDGGASWQEIARA